MQWNERDEYESPDAQHDRLLREFVAGSRRNAYGSGWRYWGAVLLLIAGPVVPIIGLYELGVLG